MAKLINASNLFDEYYYMFKNSVSEAELDRLSYVLGKEKQIDPVYFAEGCYCRECFHSEPNFMPDDTYWCNRCNCIMSLNGFCSEGREDDMKNG